MNEVGYWQRLKSESGRSWCVTSTLVCYWVTVFSSDVCRPRCVLKDGSDAVMHHKELEKIVKPQLKTRKGVSVWPSRSLSSSSSSSLEGTNPTHLYFIIFRTLCNHQHWIRCDCLVSFCLLDCSRRHFHHSPPSLAADLWLLIPLRSRRFVPPACVRIIRSSDLFIHLITFVFWEKVG